MSLGLIIAIDLVVVICLVGMTITKDFESTLPLFAFLVIVLPLEARIYFVDLFVLTTTRVVVATLLALYLFLGSQHRKSTRNSLPLKYLLILYIVWSLVSTLNSVVFVTSVKTVIDNVLEYCLVYYIFAKSISNVRTIHKIIAASVAALVVCCVFGMVEHFTHWNVTSIFPAVIHRLGDEIGRIGVGGRIRSTFPHPILFGNGLVLGIPWVLYLLSSAKTAAQKICLWVALIMMAYDLYKTSSRGPWLALALSFLALLIFSQWSIRKNLLTIVLIAAAVLVIRPSVVESLQETYQETRNPDSVRGSSYEYRYELMHAGVHALSGKLDRSLWGFGPESFYFLGLEDVVAATGKTEVLVSCDNAWALIMIETGYVGLFLVAALLTTAIFLSWRAFRTVKPPANTLCLIFLVNLGAYAFMMVSVENFGWGQQSFILWMVLAMSLAYPRLAEAEAMTKRDAAFAPQERRLQLADARRF